MRESNAIYVILLINCKVGHLYVEHVTLLFCTKVGICQTRVNETNNDLITVNRGLQSKCQMKGLAHLSY